MSYISYCQISRNQKCVHFLNPFNCTNLFNICSPHLAGNIWRESINREWKENLLINKNRILINPIKALFLLHSAEQISMFHLVINYEIENNLRTSKAVYGEAGRCSLGFRCQWKLDTTYPIACGISAMSPSVVSRVHLFWWNYLNHPFYSHSVRVWPINYLISLPLVLSSYPSLGA